MYIVINLISQCVIMQEWNDLTKLLPCHFCMKQETNYLSANVSHACYCILDLFQLSRMQ